MQNLIDTIQYLASPCHYADFYTCEGNRIMASKRHLDKEVEYTEMTSKGWTFEALDSWESDRDYYGRWSMGSDLFDADKIRRISFYMNDENLWVGEILAAEKSDDCQVEKPTLEECFEEICRKAKEI